MLTTKQIRQAIKQNGADRVMRTFEGEWSTLNYDHANDASQGKWLLFASSDTEASKRVKQGDFIGV